MNFYFINRGNPPERQHLSNASHNNNCHSSACRNCYCHTNPKHACTQQNRKNYSFWVRLWPPLICTNSLFTAVLYFSSNLLSLWHRNRAINACANRIFNITIIINFYLLFLSYFSHRLIPRMKRKLTRVKLDTDKQECKGIGKSF